MLTIALTGGIGSGKTAVTDLFQEIAAQSEHPECLTIIDADTIARELLAGSLKESPNDAIKAVHQMFGPELFTSAGQIDRTQLRSLIFSSKTRKQQLESLLHPLVYQKIDSTITALAQQTTNTIVIISIPLLFETNTENQFDRILVVDIPVELQIARISQRDHCSSSLINKIINSQVDRQSRLDHADDIIDNSGTLEELHLKVASLFQYYCSLAHKN
ncbi:MAG: dephospho-CoA kinase [gamma proteobacterium symbiont of Bathyaustriella thionipta]|nr:dephospho-CoA kinase [gamma proteobacterium symbiont of Bathyaustriella thionipta]MCU7948712.1 dephospho-CoA kinase [gamma proteobacterium symbiont of Bathyaustriella thionipta]MCU7953889.1 dephospho-CoA kinase [gamma proteobacterium symbiont of Bathyaustriella thionipta]MCU7955015.1 dephospho-CoA kinase [gamma proteobacterium symbiont of Bathyaustriella thionipta]MCU7966869.1 dephospho-CoA kinase [gamma proteobacterium symbiont of Bathyaustriella thionipta]